MFKTNSIGNYITELYFEVTIMIVTSLVAIISPKLHTSLRMYDFYSYINIEDMGMFSRNLIGRALDHCLASLYLQYLYIQSNLSCV